MSFFQTGKAQDHVIVHKVEQGQTIYSISRQYNLTPLDIKEQNPSVDESYAIKPGQLLRIEVKQGDQTTQMLEGLNKQPKFHEVQSKETLYRISKDYKIELEELKEWNQLGDSQIRVGQKLIVGWRYSNEKNTPVIEVDQPKQNNEEPVVTPQIEEPTVINEPKVVKEPIQEVPKEKPTQTKVIPTDKQMLLKERYNSEATGKSLFKESGPAIFFETDNEMLSTRYYGLYSKARVGSIIKVTNLINNNVVYVKVIGSLPDTKDNFGSMIKLTDAAKKRLATTDGKIRVEVTYTQ